MRQSFPLLVSFNFPPGFWTGIITSLVATLLIFGLNRVTHSVQRLLRLHIRFTLSGVWIGTCTLPHYPARVEAVEIYRLAMRGDNVTLEFFNYRPDETNVLKYLGAGICRGQLLSAFYYIPVREQSDSGVIVVRKVGETLKGFYAQYDLVANEELKVSPDDFVLRRIKIPWWRCIRMACGLAPYKTHADVRALYDETVKKKTAPPARIVEGVADSTPDLAGPEAPRP
jgi:hypothetical protein